jgi:hypothetical protein
MTDTPNLPAVPDPAPAVPDLWNSGWRLAQRIATTPFVPAALRGKPESVLAAILTGDELGIGPMQSLSSIHVIDGRPAASPELMRALVARRGHTITVTEWTDQSVTLAGTRTDTGSSAKVTWTLDDARRAGLAGKDNWKKYPRAMLLARATGELCRALFPDVIAGLSYTPDEMADSIPGPDDAGGWEPVHVDLIDPVTGEPPAPVAPAFPSITSPPGIGMPLDDDRRIESDFDELDDDAN